MSTESWILEVRDRLRSPPPRPLDDVPIVAARHAAFVPLYVDAGELWVILSAHLDPAVPEPSRIHFSGGELAPEEQPWEGVARIIQRAGVDTRQVLRLGELDQIEVSSEAHLTPCVGAIPRPQQPPGAASTESLEIFALPLSAFRNPRLVEDREVEVDDRIAWVRIYHVGRRRLTGVVAQILENLVERLFDQATLR